MRFLRPRLLPERLQLRRRMSPLGHLSPFLWPNSNIFPGPVFGGQVTLRFPPKLQSASEILGLFGRRYEVETRSWVAEVEELLLHYIPLLSPVAPTRQKKVRSVPLGDRRKARNEGGPHLKPRTFAMNWNIVEQAIFRKQLRRIIFLLRGL